MSSEPLHSTDEAKVEIRSPPEPRHLRADVLPDCTRTRRRSHLCPLVSFILVVLFNCAVAGAPQVIICSSLMVLVDLVNILTVAVFRPFCRGRASRIGEGAVCCALTLLHPQRCRSFPRIFALAVSPWRSFKRKSQHHIFEVWMVKLREDDLSFGGKSLLIPPYLRPWKAYSLP